MKTEQEIQELKEQWVVAENISEPYDLSKVEGFEEHVEELDKYQKDFRKSTKRERFLYAAKKQSKGHTYCIKVKMAILEAILTLDLENPDDLEYLQSAKGWLKSAINYVDYHERDLDEKR